MLSWEDVTPVNPVKLLNSMPALAPVASTPKAGRASIGSDEFAAMVISDTPLAPSFGAVAKVSAIESAPAQNNERFAGSIVAPSNRRVRVEDKRIINGLPTSTSWCRSNTNGPGKNTWLAARITGCRRKST